MFFIVGRAGSGASLLARMLMAHPQLVVAPEGGFLLNLHAKYHLGGWNQRRIDGFCRDLLAEERMRAWGLDLERLAERLYERQSVLNYPKVCDQVYASYARDVLGRSPKWIGDSNPDHALLIESVDHIFPGARYLHITRDYHDALQSPYNASFERVGPAALALCWKRYHQGILRLSREAPERFLWLRYEDLSAYPEHTLSRIHRFLELDPATEARITPRLESAHGARLPVPVRTGARRLSAYAIEQAESLCGSFAERFGYPPHSRVRRPMPLATRVGALLGLSSLVARKLAFRLLPSRAHIALCNAAARHAAGRLRADLETRSR